MKPSQDCKISKLHQFIFQTAQYFEILIAISVIIGLLITLTTLPREMATLYAGGGFNNFLKATFNIIIGIELLKMLCRHDLDSVVEVLLFAVARSIIVEHMPILETLLGILAIAILFLVRKFLFVSALDKTDNG